MRLLINGDDFGLTKGVSEAIIKCLKDGIMGDTSAMANMPFFEDAIKLAFDSGIYEMGIHLNFTCGKPVSEVSEVKSICDENGNFYRRPDLIPKDINIIEAEKEIRAQIDKFKKTGMKINHIDSHHHFYGFNKEIFNLVVDIADELKVPMRCPFNEDKHILKEKRVVCPDYFDNSFYLNNISLEYLKERLYYLKDKYNTVEFMAHPSNNGKELNNISSYNMIREKELEILTSENMKDYISKNNIKVISFSDL